MSYSSSYRDESLVVHRESMLENEVLGIGEESNSSFGSFVSLSLFDEENFQNLMKGPEITSVVKVVVDDIVSGDINTILVEFDEENTKHRKYGCDCVNAGEVAGDGGDRLNIVGSYP